MSELILPLSKISINDAPQVGTKAAALGELLRADHTVPDGLVLTTRAYAEFISPLRQKILARLTEDIIMDPAEIESAATEIRDWLEAEPFPSTLHAELDSALAAWDNAQRSSVAVRTSPPSDDLTTAFGSGVARAYLGQTNVGEIEKAAARGWAALWNSRSMYYRHRKKIVQTDVALAILIQPMIHASSAGVMFTQNPLNNSNNEIQINSIRGLGAPLTSARFHPDQFVVNKNGGGIRERTIEEQYAKLVVGDDGHTEEHGIPSDQTNTPSLTDEQVKELAEIGKRIEKFFNAPQDIEWAIAGNKIFVLQARPIGIRNA